ncbi:MAG TPA: alpha/beta hydrolase [Caulobacteraceae bacterium]|jgi:acetyl esterase/lipase|nr:alpha/beta hydrolase [Caulobacteraceae bacterium]
MAGFDLRRLLAKTLLSMPGAVLRAMSGGAVQLGGRVLDPRFQYIAHAGRNAPPLASLEPAIARAGSAASLAAFAGRPEPGVTSEGLTIAGPGGALPLRAYRPPVQDPAAPLMVFAHFGGGVIGDLETCDVFCRILAKGARCAVLSVDYRLAPEHRFPQGLEDVLAAYRWARDNGPRFGAPLGKVAIGGDSMGGNFAAVTAQEMKRAGEPQPVLQLLIYPAVDVASETQSMTTFARAYPLSRQTMEWFMSHYLAPGDDRADPRASPIRAADLSGLAPAVIVTAGFDPLVDQGEAYAKRLSDAGAPVVYRCYDHLAHAFTAFTGAIPAADIACREIAGLVREGFEGRIH